MTFAVTEKGNSMEHNFTDSEIIEALEHCISGTTLASCKGCPLLGCEVCEFDNNYLMGLALDLIKRLRSTKQSG